MIFTLDARTAVPHFPGIGRYVRSLAAAIPPHLQPDETFAVLHAGLTAPAWLDALPDTVRRHPAAVSPFGLRQQWTLPPLLVGSGVYHSPYYLMPYRPGVPAVLTVYDLIPLLFPAAVSLRARILFRITTRMALSAAAHILCISEATRADFLAHFPWLDRGRITSVPLAPAPQFSPQPDSEQRRVREKFSLPDGFALYVGSNKPHKNLARLVAAWEQVETGVPLAIAGAWDPRYPEAKIAAALQERTGRIRFLGRIEDADLPGLYSACKLFIFPSLYEGFGLPIVEALACGAHVACSNTSSLPEVAGDAAIGFNPHNVDDIAGGIRRALDTPRTPARSLSQARRFSWSRTAAATVEIYRSMAYN